jgi:glutamate synthase domain-containing protein 3
MFSKLCNTDMVTLEKPDQPDDIATLRRLLENHVKLTGSVVAKGILEDWEKELRWFVKVMPNDYRNALARKAEIEERAKKLGQRQAAGV